MDLKSALKTLSLSRLQEMAASWNLSIDPASTPTAKDYIEHLHPRMQMGKYVRSMLQQLSVQERDALWMLALHGGFLTRDELLSRGFEGNRELFQRVCTSLANKGLVFDFKLDENNIALAIPATLMRFLDLPPHLRGYLGGVLQGYSIQQLKKLAAVLPTSGRKDTSHESFTHAIRTAMLQPDVLKQYIATLSPEEQEILTQVIKRKGSCLYRELLDSENQKRFDHQKAEFVNSLIGTRALLFALVEDENKYNNLLVVPRDLYYIITRDYAADDRLFRELELSATSATARPGTIVDNSHALLRDLTIVASLFHTQEVKRLANGGVNRNDLRRILYLLQGRNPLNYALFLTSFLVARHHLIEIDGYWRVADSFEHWLQNSRKCYWEFYSWWLLESDWNEGAPEGWSGETDTAHLRARLITTRSAVLKALSGLQADKWTSFSAFAESLVPQLEVSGKGRTNQNGSGSLGMLRGVISESLNWLGITTLGMDQPATADQAPPRKGRPRKAVSGENSFSFMVAGLGAAILKGDYMQPSQLARELGEDELAPVYEMQQLIIQPNLEIVAPPDLRLDKLLFLARFCHLKNVDVMTTAELTRESLRAGLDSGISARQIQDFLSESAAVQMPETVKHLIEECSTKHGETRIGATGGFIKSDDPMVVQEFRSNPKFAPYVKEVLDDHNILLVPNTDVAKLAREMRSMGFMPRLEPETVQQTSEEKYHVALTAEELYDLVAAARLVASIEQILHADISQGRIAALAQKLRTDTSGMHQVAQHSDAATSAYEKRFRAAYDKIIEDVSDRFKTQVSKLVTRSMSTRGPTKYQFRGPNPAIDPDDIMNLLSFATDYELETEIIYVRQNRQEAQLMITPRSFEGERLYAHCVQTNADSIYALDRILKARLI